MKKAFVSLFILVFLLFVKDRQAFSFPSPERFPSTNNMSQPISNTNDWSIGSRIHGAATVEGIERLIEAGKGSTLQEMLGSLNLGDAYLEIDLAKWPDLDSPKLRVGSLDIQYSPYVAYFDPWQGVSVTKIPMGPLSAQGFYTWSNQPAWGCSIGVKPIPDLEFSVTMAGNSEELGLAWEGTMLPLPPLVFNWVLAGNQNGIGPLKLDSALSINEYLTVRMGYRKFPILADFDPVNRDRRLDDFGEPVNPIDLYQGQTGYTAGFSLKTMGLLINFDYDRYSRLNETEDGLTDNQPVPDCRSSQFGLTKVYAYDWGTLTGTFKRRNLNEIMDSEIRDSLGGGVRFNNALLRGLEITGEIRKNDHQLENSTDYQALGGIVYQSPGMRTKIVYDFVTGRVTASTDLIIHF